MKRIVLLFCCLILGVNAYAGEPVYHVIKNYTSAAREVEITSLWTTRHDSCTFLEDSKNNLEKA